MYYIKEYFKEGMLILILLFEIFVFSFSFFVKDDNEIDSEVLISNNENEIAVVDDKILNQNTNVRVDIKGAVLNPGVYVLDSNSCINDVILLAGGLKSNASTKYINLSKKVSDEMVINVFTATQVKDMEKDNLVKEECKCETIYINDCSNSAIIESGKDENINSTIDDEKKNEELISINKATKDELMSLNGIGESKASAIIEYRNNNGDFKSISDIKNVSGISDSLYEKIKDFITI